MPSRKCQNPAERRCGTPALRAPGREGKPLPGRRHAGGGVHVPQARLEGGHTRFGHCGHVIHPPWLDLSVCGRRRDGQGWAFSLVSLSPRHLVVVKVQVHPRNAGSTQRRYGRAAVLFAVRGTSMCRHRASEPGRRQTRVLCKFIGIEVEGDVLLPQ